MRDIGYCSFPLFRLRTDGGGLTANFIAQGSTAEASAVQLQMPWSDEERNGPIGEEILRVAGCPGNSPGEVKCR